MSMIWSSHNPGYQEGAIYAVALAPRRGWFDSYEWVIRVNPDVVFEDASYLEARLHDRNTSAVLAECGKRVGEKIHTDFFAARPRIMNRLKWASDSNAEKAAAAVFRSVIRTSRAAVFYKGRADKQCRVSNNGIIHEHALCSREKPPRSGGAPREGFGMVPGTTRTRRFSSRAICHHTSFFFTRWLKDTIAKDQSWGRLSPGTVAAPAREPTFVHIPKSAGTTVEKTLMSHGIRTGSFAPWLDAPPYKTDNAYSNCAYWHRPPINIVPGSLCIVREPAERLLSEFCFGIFYMTRYRVQYRGYPNAVAKDFKADCAGFNAWVRLALGCATVEGSQTIHDCHLVPQVHYASKCEVVLRFDDLREGGRARQQLLEHFALPSDTAIAPTELNASMVPKHKQKWGECARDVSLDCLEESTIRLIQRYYAGDYEGLSAYFNVPGVFSKIRAG